MNMLFPLQAPGSVELLLLLGVFLLIGLAAGHWIYRDARARGSNWAWQWAVGLIFLFTLGLVPGLIGLGVYYLVRGEKQNGASTNS